MTTAHPAIVSQEEWDKARAELLVAEKAATKQLDALAAQRRRMGMVPFDSTYSFTGHGGEKKSLLDLFGLNDTLAVYQFMHNGKGDPCPGCSNVADSVPAGALRRLDERGVSYVKISTGPIAELEEYWTDKGWSHIPIYSSAGTTFAEDTKTGQFFSFSVFFRLKGEGGEKDKVYLTYRTAARGVDKLLFIHTVWDMCPFGRREGWEDSPAGWPKDFGPA